MLLLCAAMEATGTAVAEKTVFRVCADPNYLPYSSKNGEGFENKLAEILAADLKQSVEYTWFPQRMGFIRNTLRAKHPTRDGYKCDIVMGVPHGFELAITTDPYYRSTYALVYMNGKGLDDISSPQDFLNLDEKRKAELRIAVSERSPGTQWLAKYGLFEQMVPYIAQSGDPNEHPGELMERDLRAGKVNAAILWGPVAGYIAKRAAKAEISMIPLVSEANIRFHYAISAAVRFGEKDWKNRVDESLKRNSDRIAALLIEYKVPLVDENGNLLPH
jgi:quinoprotein dehydrogenase-associated probable ABC transporter substrate-binding protein